MHLYINWKINDWNLNNDWSCLFSPLWLHHKSLYDILMRVCDCSTIAILDIAKNQGQIWPTWPMQPQLQFYCRQHKKLYVATPDCRPLFQTLDIYRMTRRETQSPSSIDRNGIQIPVNFISKILSSRIFFYKIKFKCVGS
jgi:hypothetical protein